MKFLLITTATALAFISSSSASWLSFDLFDREDSHGGFARHSPSDPYKDDDFPYSFCGGVKYKVYMEPKKGGTMRVKSLDLSYTLDPGVACGLWAYRNTKCAASKSKDVMGLGWGKKDNTTGTTHRLAVSSPVWEKKHGWKKAGSFQLICTKQVPLPSKAPAVTKKTEKAPTSDSYYDNCAFRSGCAKRWLPGKDCKKYMTDEGCNDGLFNFKENRCCCIPKNNLP
jgi:hypothetical protein